MAIAVHIERLVVDGIDVDPRQRTVFVETIAGELERLIGERGLSGRVRMGFATPSLKAAPVQLAAPFDPAACGVAVASALFRTLGSDEE
jgi:hypothetical protein